MLLFRRAVIYYVLFPVGKLTERNICPHAHFTAYICHKRPHQAVPRSYRTLINGKGVIGNQRCDIHCANHSRSAASSAGTLTVECQLLGRGSIEMLAALRAYKVMPRCNVKSRRMIMPVGTAVLRQTRKHEPQTVKQLCSRSEGGTYPRNARTLMKSQCRRNI